MSFGISSANVVVVGHTYQVSVTDSISYDDFVDTVLRFMKNSEDKKNYRQMFVYLQNVCITFAKYNYA